MLKDVEKFQIRCHHLYAYRFGDSSKYSHDSIGGDAGKLKKQTISFQNPPPSIYISIFGGDLKVTR